mmetsp:Transcript_20424/g.59120  ORF Transcript_20424/g.59120 Transcript_20424/m.59120 type:complete len:223 (+) Transcript_20424:946-1614(+)
MTCLGTPKRLPRPRPWLPSMCGRICLDLSGLMTIVAFAFFFVLLTASEELSSLLRLVEMAVSSFCRKVLVPAPGVRALDEANVPLECCSSSTFLSLFQISSSRSYFFLSSKASASKTERDDSSRAFHFRETILASSFMRTVFLSFASVADSDSWVQLSPSRVRLCPALSSSSLLALPFEPDEVARPPPLAMIRSSRPFAESSLAPPDEVPLSFFLSCLKKRL